ncbi:C2H2-type zinc finger protein [Arsenicibacter rosenii]|uniref:C2H2-type domain-containing protein n=1 Tax=Arsenicibacter rosenii TaxID=1750698 RepID=A0A1S2VSD4_9BACT|nr:hypothetical protein BLX24_03810 [Arsenicibacter rosenii]
MRLDDERRNRLERNTKALAVETDARRQYDIAFQILSDCRALHLPVTQVLTVATAVQPVVPPVPSGSFICPECNRSFNSHHALCGHMSAHRK